LTFFVLSPKKANDVQKTMVAAVLLWPTSD
jgi:hypothetical protein